MKGLALLLPVLVALQVGVQPALAWAWPVDGPVLRPFVLGDDPYAGGQHRGIDIGAPEGAPVRAPVSGSISFAGTVPTGGKTITIRTIDGYSVTLQHLGAYSVDRGVGVAEGDVVASVGEATEPYVYLSVRTPDEPDGYVDPLSLLPPPAPAPPDPPPVEPDPVPAPGHGGANHPHHVPAPQPTWVEAPGPEAERPAPSAARQAQPSRLAPRAHAGEARHADRPRHAWRPLTAHRPVSPAAGIPSQAPPLARSGQPHGSGAPFWPFPAVLAVLGLAVVGAGLRRRFGELGHAGAADGAPSVLLQRASPAAEDADRLRLREQDHVVLDRDLERILLAKGEALANLDRNDDPTEVVDVADDPRLRCTLRRARPQRTLSHCVRPHCLTAFRLRRTSTNTSPRFAISNHHSHLRGRAESFV
jgi:Peptidase family M23